ncbi:hypothetical protein K474DRAFT_1667262 [Panus rudis PR-1116 ss-1]|nr:hypothetical protein K474DRAFT_1667262 [Panus rudis PR-1116 ss-1]
MTTPALCLHPPSTTLPLLAFVLPVSLRHPVRARQPPPPYLSFKRSYRCPHCWWTSRLCVELTETRSLVVPRGVLDSNFGTCNPYFASTMK